MSTIESIFYWIGALLLSAAILLYFFYELEPASAVRLMMAGAPLYAGAYVRYTRRLKSRNQELEAEVCLLRSA